MSQTQSVRALHSVKHWEERWPTAKASRLSCSSVVGSNQHPFVEFLLLRLQIFALNSRASGLYKLK